jgi:3-oxoacyl-[acyl-carrier-protein] synthase-3
MSACGVRIVGIGVEIPEQVVTTAEVERRLRLCERFAVPNGWLEEVTGVRQHHWAGAHVRPSALAARAAWRALAAARLDAGRIDTVLYAGASREDGECSTARLVADAVGAPHARAFDLVHASSGLLDALDVADALVRSGKAEHVLVAAGERAAFAVDWDAGSAEEALRSVGSLVAGDGGGALVLAASDDAGRGLRARAFVAAGAAGRDVERPNGARACELCGAPVGRAFLSDGRELVAASATLLRPAIEAVLRRSGWGYGELDVVFCAQPTKRAVDAAMVRLGEAAPIAHRLWSTAGRFGNTSTVGVPLAMSEARAAGALRDGAKVLVLGASGGMDAAALTLVW